jgi:uncharacterized protein
MAGLVWSDAIAAEARAVRAEVERQLAGLGIPGRLELTGAASLPGVLTKGDIDLHLRVTGRSGFADAVERIGDVYRPASPAAWAETLAVFEIPGGRSTGLAVTPVDSEHDRRFRRCWIRLREEPALLREYNAMKLGAFGDPSYERRKSDFFTRIADA